MGAWPWAAHTRHDHAAMLLARDGPGDRERAEGLLTDAISTYEELGMESWAKRAVALAEGQSDELDALDALILDRAVPGAGGRALDGVDRLHPARDLAEHGVLAVEPRRRSGGDDEELRAVRVRAGVGHRQGAADDLVLVELVLERVAGAAACRFPPGTRPGS